jgi:SAM-dependent methyltransferase
VHKLAVIQSHGSQQTLNSHLTVKRRDRFVATAELLLAAPEQVASALKMPDSSIVAVFSAGPDLFASPFAERVGRRGLVYSLELTDELVHPVARRPVSGYVRVPHNESGRIPLANDSVDIALWAFAFSTLGHVAGMLMETRRILRPGGRLAVVDWIRREESCGPRRDDRVSSATCERCLAASGFGLIDQRSLNASHYLVVGRRPLTDSRPSALESA